MFNEVHHWNRANLTNYLEVFLKVPLKELRRRDPKDIYKRYDAGKLKYVAGLDLLVDEPKTSDWLFDFNFDNNIHECPYNSAQEMFDFNQVMAKV